MSKKPTAGSSAKQAKTTEHAQPFLTDVKTLRARARKNIDKGAVAEGYARDRATVRTLRRTQPARAVRCRRCGRYHARPWPARLEMHRPAVGRVDSRILIAVENNGRNGAGRALSVPRAGEHGRIGAVGHGRRGGVRIPTPSCGSA